MAGSHAAKIIHCAVHVWHLLHLVLILLEFLLILIIALVVSRCLKLSLYQLLLFDYLLLALWDSVRIWLDTLRRFESSQSLWLKCLSQICSRFLSAVHWGVVGIKGVETYFHLLSAIQVWVVLEKFLLFLMSIFLNHLQSILDHLWLLIISIVNNLESC